ncbi:glycerophosphodiester phosphodiesterase family protein [Azospirillum sp. sgz301742]
MIVLAHRGWWTRPEERNTLPAFERALEAGFGLELDVRDQDGRLVVSHDPPVGGTLDFATLLASFDRFRRPGPLAINIKSDGLQPALAEMLKPLAPHDYFVFDMSIPDTLGYLRAGLTVYTRQSEYEPQPALLDKAAGVWLDAFEGEWFDTALVRRHGEAGRAVALVSPELHRRPHRNAWETWRSADGPGVMLCTDHPGDAKDFFHAD